MDGRAAQRYNRYHEWWAKIEKKLTRLAIVLFIILYSLQLLNFVLEQRSSGPLSSAVGKLEGVPVAENQTQINMGTIELTIISKSDSSKIQIYINGEYCNSFNQKSVSLNVKDNDIIEISGIYSEYPATVKITSRSNNIKSPQLNESVKVGRNYQQVGRIRLK